MKKTKETGTVTKKGTVNKVTIPTEVVVQLTEKALKGVGNNKFMPVTSFLQLAIENGIFSIKSYDGMNFLTVSCPDVDAPDFKVVVNADTFGKLVAKTSSETITFMLEDKFLQFKGNGTFKLALPLAGSGEVSAFPASTIFSNKTKSKELEVAKLKRILAVNGSSVANTMENPSFTGYYTDKEHTITTTGETATVSNLVFMDKPTLLNANFIKLFSLIEEETVTMMADNENISIAGKYIEIEGGIRDGLEDFPAEETVELVNKKGKSKFTVSTSALLSVIERFSIFTDKFGFANVKVSFTEKGMIFSSKKIGSETLPYAEKATVKPLDCEININYFKQLISSATTEGVEIEIGDAESLAIITPEARQLMAYLTNTGEEDEDDK